MILNPAEKRGDFKDQARELQKRTAEKKIAKNPRFGPDSDGYLFLPAPIFTRKIKTYSQDYRLLFPEWKNFNDAKKSRALRSSGTYVNF
ncbi:MAG: hypothetical protein ACOX1Y_12905 [Zhaonellaceae bacterium]